MSNNIYALYQKTLVLALLQAQDLFSLVTKIPLFFFFLSNFHLYGYNENLKQEL